VQVSVIPIGEAHEAEAKVVHGLLRTAGIRSTLDLSNANIGFGKKVRAAKTEKIPYFVIIGDKDIAAGKITLESRDKGNLGQITKNELVAKLLNEISNKSL
jgi:threonyl-tRNA synthetase